MRGIPPRHGIGTRGDGSGGGSPQEEKHGGNVIALGHKFFGLAVETYGHMHGDVWKALKRVSGNLREEIRAQFMRDMFHALSVSVQSGNAKILESALRRSRRCGAYWVR